MVQAIGRGSSGEPLTAICMLFDGGLHAVNLHGNLIGFSFQKLPILRSSKLEKQSLGFGFSNSWIILDLPTIRHTVYPFQWQMAVSSSHGRKPLDYTSAGGALCPATTRRLLVAGEATWLAHRCRAAKTRQPVWAGTRWDMMRLLGWGVEWQNEEKRQR